MNSPSFFVCVFVWEKIYLSFNYKEQVCQVSILTDSFPPNIPICHSTVTWLASFLLRNSLMLCGLTCMGQVSFLLLPQNSLLVFEFWKLSQVVLSTLMVLFVGICTHAGLKAWLYDWMVGPQVMLHNWVELLSWLFTHVDL